MAIIHNLIARFRADTGAFDRNIKKSRTHMTRFGRDMQRISRQLLTMAGVGGGLYAVKRGLEAVTKAALAQEKAEKDLIAAVGGSISIFKSYAAELQKVTVYGDEQILSQMTYARNLGVTTDKLEEAAKAAIGLAARFRIDLSSAMMLVGRASQGQTQLLTRYGIVIDQTLSDQEKFNRLLKIGADSFGLAEAEAKTAAGSIQQMRNSISDTAETIGDVLLPTIQDMSKTTTKFLQDNSAALKRYVSDYVEGVKIMRKWGSPLGMGINMYRQWKAANAPEAGITAEPEMSLQQQMSARILEKHRKELDKLYGELQKEVKGKEQAAEISKRYIDRVSEEIKLTGLVSDARQHAAQMIKLENEFKEKGIDGTTAAIKQLDKLKEKFKELAQAQRLARIAEDIGDAFANAFEDAIFEAKKFGDIMKSLLRDIAKSVIRNIVTQPLANQITMMLAGTSATVAHSGGIVGQIGRRRKVPSLAFAGAPRFHQGLMPGEMPTILQRGEGVIPKGGGMMAPIIIINNQSGTKIRQEGQPLFDGKRYIINVVADDITSGGTLRKLIENTG